MRNSQRSTTAPPTLLLGARPCRGSHTSGSSPPTANRASRPRTPNAPGCPSCSLSLENHRTRSLVLTRSSQSMTARRGGPNSRPSAGPERTYAPVGRRSSHRTSRARTTGSGLFMRRSATTPAPPGRPPPIALAPPNCAAPTTNPTARHRQPIRRNTVTTHPTRTIHDSTAEVLASFVAEHWTTSVGVRANVQPCTDERARFVGPPRHRMSRQPTHHQAEARCAVGAPQSQSGATPAAPMRFRDGAGLHGYGNSYTRDNRRGPRL